MLGSVVMEAVVLSMAGVEIKQSGVELVVNPHLESVD
jgi:hypothetical protein